jgi:hypothetical protein
MILLLAPLIAIAVIGGAALVLRSQKGAQRELVGTVLEPDETHGTMPSVLYFTGEACTICHTAQRPALRSLAATLDPGIEIREIDIAVEPELARRYRRGRPGDRYQCRVHDRRSAPPPARRRRNASRRLANRVL